MSTANASAPTRPEIEALCAHVAQLRRERESAARRGHQAIVNTANYNMLREIDSMARALRALINENERLREDAERWAFVAEHGYISGTEDADVMLLVWLYEGTHPKAEAIQPELERSGHLRGERVLAIVDDARTRG